ncbi:MAG TPA: BTAD domain-containing putative transcriptional regulator [Casimicrobiaceae bacterium]|nr:BTAD domain-containing putative transcriptional regulator [Casimicrobiaceae bacterium]
MFSLLDEAARRPIVWVCAPPGAGKTTLVASYLEARKLKHLWYQCDAADADTATFVHYIRLAAGQLAGRAAVRLPQFTSEPGQDLARFARGFFRDLFSALPNRCAVVFDNFHEPRTRRVQRAAFAQGLEELPEGITVIVLSRGDPPPEFARLVASRHIARIDEAELRCTPEEAEAILGKINLDTQTLHTIQKQSDGWVAALVLLREHLSRKGAVVDQSIGEGKEAIFQYFAGEIFNHARPENRRALMLTAIPPSITAAEAVALSGNEEAPRLLDYLYRHHLFTHLRHGEQPSYHYHALFREFLLYELDTRVSRDERLTATRRAGRLLAERGQVSEALELYRDAKDWDAMRSLIHEHALEWARQGRAQAVSDWIEALPSSMRESDPWLAYWFGRAWVFAQPLRGRPSIERAYTAFRNIGELRGEALALSTIVTSYYYEWAYFAPLDRWLPEFERLLGGERAADLDPESELRARAAWLMALLLRNPEDENVARCAQRLDALIDGERDPNLRVLAGAMVFNYINWKTEGEEAPSLIARIEPMLTKPDVSPLMQVQWRTHLSFWHYAHGRYGESTQVMVDARAIAERYGLEAYLFDIDHAEVSALINKGEHAAAKALLDVMEHRLSPTRRMQWPFFHHVRSMLEQRLDHRKAAIEHAERAVALARELQVPSVQLPHFLARLAWARAAAGDGQGAMEVIDEAIALASPFERSKFEERRELLAIEADYNAGNLERVSVGLAKVLGEHRARGDVVFMRSRPDWAARLASHALEHGIETEFVRAMIQRDALAAPPDAGPNWPFRLRVRVLGGFGLVRDGQPVVFTGKAQQRPLDLLKLVVALGAFDVDIEHVTASLWPDADGAAAKSSFDSALFRLRKLLDIENVITLSAGKLSLDRTRAWTDVWSLDAALENAGQASEGDSTDASRVHAARRLLEAYPGPLLGADEDAWIAKPRDLLRARFVRTLLFLGEKLEARRDWTTAVDLYRRGLEADNLAEPLYRGLMRALAAKGDHAEAMNAFRRCRELLSIVLGTKPSGETERLHQEIMARRSP